MAFALQALGRLSEAAVQYRRAIKLKPDYVEAHTNLGNVLKELGSHRDAAACYERVIALKPSAEAHYNLANTLSQLGRLDEAVSSYRRALALKPDLVEAHNNLANALVSQGRLDDALIHFQRALALDPNLVEAHVNFGTTLLQQGKLDAAAEELERALGIDGTFADAHTNLGNVYLAQGRLDEAAQCYRQALALKPEVAEAHNNLGIVLAARGEFEEANLRFRGAIARKPDFVDAHNNLARASLSMGQPADALAALLRALAIAETPETKSLFVHCVRALPVVPETEDFHALMIRALSEPWGRANDLAPAAARVVKQDGVIKSCIARVMEAWPRRLPARELLDRSVLTAISRHRLLRCLMESASIGDIELERLLTAARFAMLEIACDPADRCGPSRRRKHARGRTWTTMLGFLLRAGAAMFPQRAGLRAYRRRIRSGAAAAGPRDRGDWQPAPQFPNFRSRSSRLTFRSHSLPGAELLLDRAWSDAITGVLIQQVREPAEERQLRASIPALTAIENEVSRQVRQQYEENPYPRWAKAEPAGTAAVVRSIPAPEIACCRLPRASASREIEILIAGCGTGQHAIETAQRFAGAERARR